MARRRSQSALARLDDEAFLAALQGWLDAPDPACLAPLSAAVRGARVLGRREEAARCLAFLPTDAWPEAERTAHAALLRQLAGERSIWPPARAFAFEGLANRARGRCDAETAQVIGWGLRDWDPEVRFWACYAAWKAHDRGAVRALERLAREPVVVPMLWSVHLEAQDALGALRGRRGPPPTHAIQPVGTYHTLRKAALKWPFDPLPLLGALPGVAAVASYDVVGPRELLVDIEGEVDRSAGWQPVEGWQWRGWVAAWGERGMVTLQRVG